MYVKPHDVWDQHERFAYIIFGVAPMFQAQRITCLDWN